MKLAPLALTLLASCSAYRAEQARTRVLGLTRADMEACAGVPKAHDQVGDASIYTYQFDRKSAGLTVDMLLLGKLSLDDAGQCESVWTLRGDRVVALHYTAVSSGWGGPLSACAPLIRDCLR